MENSVYSAPPEPKKSKKAVAVLIAVIATVGVAAGVLFSTGVIGGEKSKKEGAKSEAAISEAAEGFDPFALIKKVYIEAENGTEPCFDFDINEYIFQDYVITAFDDRDEIGFPRNFGDLRIYKKGSKYITSLSLGYISYEVKSDLSGLKDGDKIVITLTDSTKEALEKLGLKPSRDEAEFTVEFAYSLERLSRSEILEYVGKISSANVERIKAITYKTAEVESLGNIEVVGVYFSGREESRYISDGMYILCKKTVNGQESYCWFDTYRFLITKSGNATRSRYQQCVSYESKQYNSLDEAMKWLQKGKNQDIIKLS